MAFTILKLGGAYSCCSNLLRISLRKHWALSFFILWDMFLCLRSLLCQQRVTRLMTYRPILLQSSSSSLVHTASYWKSFHLMKKKISSSSWQVRIHKPKTTEMELYPSLSRVSSHGAWISCQNASPWHLCKAQQTFLYRAGRHWDFQAIIFHRNNIQSRKNSESTFK